MGENKIGALASRTARIAAPKTPTEKTVIRRQIEATDRLMYELYGLTDEEIAVVEEATNR